MRVGRFFIWVLLAGCVEPPRSSYEYPVLGAGPYLMAGSEIAHYPEPFLLQYLSENRSISGGGEACTQRVPDSFVRRIEGLAAQGAPIATLKGLEWSHWGEPAAVGYLAIITRPEKMGPGMGRVALADVSVLETRDGKLFKLPEEVFDKAVKIILAKLNGLNCPFEIYERQAANR